MDNEDLYKRLIKEIGNLNANDFNFKGVRFKGLNFKKILVAQHLIEKANLDKKMKFTISQILDQLAKSPRNQKKSNF